MDYNGMTVVQLKTLCRERGLRVSGNKDEVIIRLMENDEASNPFQTRAAPVPQPMPMPMYQTQPMGGYVQPQPQYIRVQSQKEEMSKTIGGFVILYAFFRLFWAMVFSIGIGGSASSWLLSIPAFLLGIGFLVGGTILYAGYRNGVYVTLGVLVVSGMMSVLFHGDDPNPVSVAWGEEMILTSIMCSFICMALVALPIFMSQLKPGWPANIERAFGLDSSTSSDKDKIQCTHCSASLQVPAGYSGKIQCPSCQKEMRV